ncbi:MAG: beta-ketoacyl synthase [Chitinophagaceae bacterium]|nr:beta-ketoacyl synthase [Chitinophagaceae bacterium]
MREVFIVSDNIVSPLGFTAGDNFNQLKKGVSGIRLQQDEVLSPEPVYASLLDKATPFPVSGDKFQTYTKFEKLLVASVQESLSGYSIDTRSKKTVLIISSTKGNISLIEPGQLSEKLNKRIALHVSAQLVADYFHFTTKPIVVSHACISGLVAMTTGMRLLQSGQYDHAIVAGADIITKFIFSGFQSFQAISAGPCKPFDANRKGITLGEGAATVILSVNKPSSVNCVKITGGAISNDANHISGPSRTGEELFQSVKSAMNEAGVNAADIDFISAHGTATIYNDEMEAKAINLAGLQEIPVNSLKGYYGHTLGAAGLIETVIAIHSLNENVVLPTAGFREPGTSKPLNVTSSLQEGFYNACLKTASGFGGCNAAVVLQKAV